MHHVPLDPRRNAYGVGHVRAAPFGWLALCLCGAAGAQTVLVLQPGNPDAPEYGAIVAGLTAALAVASPEETRVYGEFIDAAFTEPHDRGVFADYLGAKYADSGVDAVIALSDEAVAFVAEHRAALGSVPLVYVARAASAAGAIPHSSSVVVPFLPARTVELALQLQPDLEDLFVVSGPPPVPAADSAELHTALEALSSRVNLRFLEGLTRDELLERVAHLPQRSAVLYAPPAALGGARGRELAQRLAANANAPVYGGDGSYIGLGIVGGFMAPSERVGAELARQTLRMLHGEDSAAAVVSGASFIVDGGALRHWSLDQARLPVDTELELPPASTWTRYRAWIITLFVLVAVQLALIVTLLVQSVKWRRDRQALAETAHRFRLARIAGKVGIWQWDLDKDEFIVEPELAELLGYREAHAETPPADGAALVHEEDLPKLRDAARAHAQGLTPHVEIRYRMRDKGGNTRWLLARGQALAKRNRLIGTAIDLTDDKLAEDEKARTLAQLREQQAELAHLGRAAMAGALSGAVAHELNQPLSAIMSNARAGLQFIERGAADREDIKEILADIESDGRRAGEVISQLRSLLRRGEGQLAAVDLDAVVEQVLRLIHSEIVDLNIKVLHERAAGVPRVSADSVQLQQVLLNLLSNACDALKGVDPRARRITIRAAALGPGRVRLSVSDNGCGLGADNPERLFKPFFTTKRSGLGLGLSISRSIVDAHGGRIWAENNPDEGATFHVELAVAAAERVAQ